IEQTVLVPVASVPRYQSGKPRLTAQPQFDLSGHAFDRHFMHGHPPHSREKAFGLGRLEVLVERIPGCGRPSGAPSWSSIATGVSKYPEAAGFHLQINSESAIL